MADLCKVGKGVRRVHPLRRVVTLVFYVGTVLLMKSGCVPAETSETAEEEEYEDVDEYVAEVWQGLDSADKRPGWDPAGGVNSECMNACQRFCAECVQGCGKFAAEKQPDCIPACVTVYQHCIRNCGYSRGGCLSLNSAECNPWWDSGP